MTAFLAWLTGHSHSLTLIVLKANSMVCFLEVKMNCCLWPYKCQKGVHPNGF